MAEQASTRRRLAASIRARTRSSFHCSGCSRDFRGHRAWNAHHAAKHAGRWASASARKAARSMGKDADNARRHALGWLEAAGLREWRKVPFKGRDGKERTRQVPVLTDRARARPELRGRLRGRDLRVAKNHDAGHERAKRNDGHATRHGSLADGHAAIADGHADEGHRLRGRVHQTQADLHRGLALIRGQRAEHHRDRADTRAARTR